MRGLRTLGTVALLAVGALYAVAQANSGTAIGQWRLNVDKSDYGQMPKPKSGVLNVMSDTAAEGRWRATITYPDGKKETYNFSGPEDGKPHPVAGNNPWKTAAYTRGDNTVTTADISMKDGSTLKQEFTITGDTMTVKNTSAQGSGTEVWERVKGGASRP